MLAINLSARPAVSKANPISGAVVVPGMDNQRNDVGRRTKSQRESRSASVSLPDCPTDRNMIRLGWTAGLSGPRKEAAGNRNPRLKTPPLLLANPHPPPLPSGLGPLLG
ncbi:hypothetical protein K0M31_008430 [Melipona bicolor]|uniref:Uncharacterized protein n=1 Tax=Melipona bicolor TaxID=60889 RepID=A0AA40FQY6_9HYME|nr:hypothetical protein K0M31_008430 [Melipona bicolor]